MTKQEKKDVILQFLRQISKECTSHKCCEECPIDRRNGCCISIDALQIIDARDEDLLTTIDVVLGDDTQEDTVEAADADQNRDTDVVVQFLRRWQRVCKKTYDNRDCSTCPLWWLCNETDKDKLRRLVQQVNEQGRLPSYYDDFMRKFPNAPEHFWQQTCRAVLYTGKWDCPKGLTRTTDECKACWDEEMEV